MRGNHAHVHRFDNVGCCSGGGVDWLLLMIACCCLLDVKVVKYFPVTIFSFLLHHRDIALLYTSFTCSRIQKKKQAFTA